jgi:hypothetical protein
MSNNPINPPPLDYETPPPPPPDDDPDDPIRSKVRNPHYSTGSYDHGRPEPPTIFATFLIVILIVILCCLLIVGICAMRMRW